MSKHDMLFWFGLKLGISADLFTLLFLYLKLTNATSMDWIQVLAPLVLYVACFPVFAVYLYLYRDNSY